MFVKATHRVGLTLWDGWTLVPGAVTTAFNPPHKFTPHLAPEHNTTQHAPLAPLALTFLLILHTRAPSLPLPVLPTLVLRSPPLPAQTLSIWSVALPHTLPLTHSFPPCPPPLPDTPCSHTHTLSIWSNGTAVVAPWDSDRTCVQGVCLLTRCWFDGGCQCGRQCSGSERGGALVDMCCRWSVNCSRPVSLLVVVVSEQHTRMHHRLTCTLQAPYSNPLPHAVTTLPPNTTPPQTTHLCDCCCECGLAVINVPDCPHIHVGLGARVDVVAAAVGALLLLRQTTRCRHTLLQPRS